MWMVLDLEIKYGMHYGDGSGIVPRTHVLYTSFGIVSNGVNNNAVINDRRRRCVNFSMQTSHIN